MAEHRIPVTVVNHAAVAMAVSPEVVWGSIRGYLSGEVFGAAGFRVEPLDEPSAVLGGYRLVLERDGSVIDQRIVHITEVDEGARRLSLRADYLSYPGGLQVYATYQALEDGNGACYALDCHSNMSVEVTADGPRTDVAATVDQFKSASDTFLREGLEKLRQRLEEAASSTAPAGARAGQGKRHNES